MTIDPSSLGPGESLLWSDHPIVDAYCKRKGADGFLASSKARLSGLALLASGVVLSGFDIIQNGNGIAFAIGFTCVLLALAMLYLPVRIRRDARRTNYAFTDRRAIIEIPGILLRNRISVPFSEIRTIEVRRGASEDVLFRDYEVKSESGSYFDRDGFLAIHDAPKVSRLLRAAVERATGTPLSGGAP